VQLAFGWIVGDRLKNTDRQTILGAIEIENVSPARRLCSCFH